MLKGTFEDQPYRQQRLETARSTRIDVREQGPDVLVLRFYESCGERATCRLRFTENGTLKEANLMEETRGDLPLSDGRIDLSFRPFQIRTLLWCPSEVPVP